MKSIILSLSVLLCAGICNAQAKLTSIAIGASLPMATHSMTNIDNGQVTLASQKTQRGLLVMFSCNTCPFVVKAEARTQEAIAKANLLGIGFVILNSNTAQHTGVDSKVEMRIYGKPKYAKIPYLVDENATVANAFGATRTPEVFLFDGDGKLVYKGSMEDNPGNPAASTTIYITDAMTKMLTNDVINPNTTKSIGCSIKR